jgi:transcription termination/antitermination protein NusA
MQFDGCGDGRTRFSLTVDCETHIQADTASAGPTDTKERTMNQELLRQVESIAREKGIAPDVILDDLEMAIASAIRKANEPEDEIIVTVNHSTGEIAASVNGVEMSIQRLGRIAAQTAKQVMIQRIREAERGSICDEYSSRKGQIVSGVVSRWEGSSLVVELDRVEAFLPKSEQIPGDSHRPGQRVRAMILDVRENPGSIRIILSRTHPDFIRSLLEVEVPEVSEGIIELQGLAREAGYRTKVAVHSVDPKVDAVGACVGIRGSRIRNIVEELGGEKIDVVPWNESSKILIANALKPAKVAEIALCFELGRATVVVPDDQLSLAIGKRGQNVRLAARLTGWDVDILTPEEFNAALDVMEETLTGVEGVEPKHIDQITALGMVSIHDVDECGPASMISELEMSEELAKRIVSVCGEAAAKMPAKGKGPRADAQAAPASDAPATEETSTDAPVTEEAAPVEDSAAAEEAPVVEEEATEEPKPTETE